MLNWWNMMNLLDSVTFRVKDDSYSTFYKVYIQKFKDPKSFHSVAPVLIIWVISAVMKQLHLIQLQEMLDKNMLKAKNPEYDQRHTVAKMKIIDLKTLRLLSSPEYLLRKRKNICEHSKANIESAKDETVKATVDLDGKSYKVIIRKNEERNFDTSCDYEDTEHPLCLPKVIVFLQLLNVIWSILF